MHACVFCGSVMRLLLLPAADGSGKRLCCWQCEAAGRMDHVCWVDDTYCLDCGGTAAADAPGEELLRLWRAGKVRLVQLDDSQRDVILNCFDTADPAYSCPESRAIAENVEDAQ